MPRFINSTHATRPARYSAPEWGEEYQALPRYSVPVTASIRVNPTRSANAYVPRQSTFPRPERAIQYQAVPRTAASIALRRAIEHREQSPATVTINPAGLSRASRGGLPPSDPTRLTTSAPAATRINPALFAQTYAPRPPTFLSAPPRATAPHEPSRTPVFMNVREAIAPPVATAASPRTTATIGRRWAIERREQSPATVTINPAGLSQANRGLPPSDRRRLTTSAPAATRINPGLLAQTYVPRPPTFLTVPPRATAPHEPSRTLVFMNVREAIAPPVATAIRPRITDRWAAENQLETRHAIEQCIRGRAANDQKILTIMRGVFRQEQLYAFAECKVAQQQAARLTSDPVETRLYYTLALKERLQLPGKTQHITFTRLAGVTEQEVQRAGDKVLCLEKVNPQGLINFIQANEHWQRYLQQHYQSQHDQDTSITKYGTEMEQLEANSGAGIIQSGEYLAKCNQLMQERQATSKAWYRAKTLELVERYLGSSQRSNRLAAYR